MTVHGSSEWSVKLRVCISALAKCSSGGQVVVGGYKRKTRKDHVLENICARLILSLARQY